ncbi:DEAD/DEAH box helicase [Prosthecomicrobium pneumaticum]|uniref:DEAD-box ATP-dependent RNA helicase RhpA n=1 Tax=Prosthecomicrobium pneumaticum TaxID=81895 RepID=A0A7W9L2U7_9HYPH|nr:DEAD/DEAH box helicase [Prosthecomicrobium pneumaticum]MBB5753863.1 ATP-dependent RNA helicase RhlE [Prosthecomicrobium pneumaticum]
MDSSLRFADLGLAENLVRTLASAGFVTPTPIQTQAIPHLLAGRDVLGIAQTGTGKTAAFGLPIVEQLAAMPSRPGPHSVRALILAPTRELAVQIDEQLKRFSAGLPLRRAVVLGGVGMEPQSRALARGVDILVATPGRLLDHIERRSVRLDLVSHFVLDEADRMLDMGFIRDVKRIVAMLPKQRQSLLFSATMPDDVAKLAAGLLNKPVRVEVTPEVVTVERIEQQLYRVPAADKRRLLLRLLDDPEMRRVVVFTRTKHGANRVAEHLEKAGIGVAALHGNKSQGARQRALGGFKDGSVRVLVATDIAARGIDVAEISHVVNYELPAEPETYVHRIGRTARAGRGGMALSLVEPAEARLLAAITKLIRRAIPETPLPAGMPAPQPRSAEDKPATADRRGREERRPVAAEQKPARRPRRRRRPGPTARSAAA